MGVWNKFKAIDQKFAWSFLGCIVGIIGITFSVYTIFFHKTVPSIKYEVITNTNVLDIKEDINRVDILFDSVSIKETKQNLRVITLKITNEGNANLNSSYFDSNYPLGFIIENAKIVQKPEIIDVSNEYINETIKIIQNDSSKVTFSNIIIDQQHFFIVKTLVLVRSGYIPNIKPIGYISGAGTPKLIFLNEESDTSQRNFIEKLLDGHIGIHLMRFFMYLIILILLILLLELLTRIVEDTEFEKKKRKKTIEKYNKITEIHKEQLSEKVLMLYLDKNEYYLQKIKKILDNPSKIIKYQDYLKMQIEFTDYSQIVDKSTEYLLATKQFGEIADNYREKDLSCYSATIIDELEEIDVIKIVGESVTIDKSFHKTLNDFLYFIKTQ